MNDQTPIPRRIGKRLALWIGVSALTLGGGLLAALVPLERAAVEQAAVDQVGLLAEAVAATYEVADEATRSHPSRSVLAQVARAPNVMFAEVIDHAGVVRTSNLEEHIGGRRVLAKGLRELRIEGDTLVVTHNMPWTQSCVGCHSAQHDPVGAVVVGVNAQAALERLENFHLLGGLGVLLIFGVLVALILLMTDRLVTRPVFALARLMQRAKGGDFLVRAHEREDEVGALGTAFNEMLRAITDMKATEIEREADLEQARKELALKRQLEETAEQLTASNHALERRVQAQGLLMDAAHRLGSTLAKDALIERLADLVEKRLGWADYAIFLVHEGSDHEPVLRMERQAGELKPDEEDDVGVGVGPVGLVAETGAPHREGELLCVPMLHKGRVVGVLRFRAAKEGAFDDDEVELLQALGAQAAMGVVNADLYEATVELSVTDPLTDLMNRRAMDRRLEIEVPRAQRFRLPLAVVMVDVDHFKKYNDRMGHLLGDEALIAVARALEGTVRRVDAVARYGGEEFCVILPRTDEEAARDVADKLREAVCELDLPGAANQPLGHLSISLGFAIYPDDLPAALSATVTEALLDTADRALFEAKNGGRNRVVSASEALGIAKKPALDGATGTEPGQEEADSTEEEAPLA